MGNRKSPMSDAHWGVCFRCWMFQYPLFLLRSWEDADGIAVRLVSELIGNGNLTCCHPVATVIIFRVETVAEVVEVKLGTNRNVLGNVVVAKDAGTDVMADEILVSLIVPSVTDVLLN